MGQPESYSAQFEPSPASLMPAIWRRVLPCLAVWSFFGLFIGATSPPGPGFIGIISGAIAGVIVIAWIGVLLGLIGGEAMPTFVGGLWGILVGYLYCAWSSRTIVLYNVNLALIIGGMVGGNCSMVSRLLRRRSSRRSAVAN